MVPVAVKVGDTVLLPDYGGNKIKLGNEESEYFLFRDSDVLGVLHKWIWYKIRYV